MRLITIGLSAMTAASACVAALFVYALYAPTRPPAPLWTTAQVRSESNDDWSKRWVGTEQVQLPTVIAARALP
jgi:hypothetical protein